MIINLDYLARFYGQSLLVGGALIPSVAIWYLLTFSPTLMPRFENHGFHELAIALATGFGLFVSYVSWRSYRASGEGFLRWLTAAFLMFTLVYAPHGVLTRTADHNIWLFLLFGPASRLAMLCCLAYGLSQYGKPAEDPARRSVVRFWRWILGGSVGIVGLVAMLATSPFASSPWIRLPMEFGALLLCVACLLVIVWRRIDSPLMVYYAVALMLFGQADIAFMLAKPWDHLWWLAHAIFAAGFFILSGGVVRALLTTRSFAAAYSQEKLMRALEHEKAQAEAANQALEASQIRLLAIFDGIQDAVITIGPNGIIRSFNQSAEKIFGYQAIEAVGQNVAILIPGDRGEHDAAMRNYSVTHKPKVIGKLREVTGRRKSGEAFPMEIWVTETELSGEPLFTSSMRDITARKAMEEEVRLLAFYDPLTKLPNRRLLEDRLTHAMANGKRSDCYGALMFLDLDNFKLLNDTYGHEAGDFLLLDVARRLKGCLRERDTVARFGGDEFIVVLSELTSDRVDAFSQAALVAEKIRDVVAAPYQLNFKRQGKPEEILEHRCTVSIGVCLFTGQEAGREALFKGADAAMYEAKGAGRNQVRFSEQVIE